MPERPLFYDSIIPLNSETHGKHRVKPAERPFGFAETTHLIPAVLDEFPVAARFMPIVFAPANNGFTSVFLCGLKPGQNLFVDADGRWNEAYVPVYLRRYPFILGEREGADPVVCIDESFAGFAQSDEGETLFDESGAPSSHLSNVINLVRDFAASAERTEAFCQRLSDMDLFKSVTIDVQQGGDAAGASIHGLSVVDEEKLNALSNEDFAKLREGGVLTAIYAHLFSVSATNMLASKLGAGEAAAANDLAATG